MALDSILTTTVRRLGIMQPRPLTTLHVGGAITADGSLTGAGWSSTQPTASMSQIQATTTNFVLAGPGAGHLASNCYYTSADQWYRYDTGQSAMVVVFLAAGQVVMYYAAPGANPISWAKGNVRLGNVNDTSTTWQPLSYVNGWAAYADGNFGANTGWRKMPDGLIIMRGLVNAGTQGVMAVLPAGARPVNTMLFAAAMNGGVVRLDLDNVGNLGCSSGTLAGGAWNNAWISLNGISYLAEP